MAPHATAVASGVFDRLGGFEAIERAVVRLVPRLAEDPSLNGLVQPGKHDELRWQVELLLTDRLGGPMAYDGPEPAHVRDRFGIDGARWGTLLSHLLECLSAECGDAATVGEAERILHQLGSSLGFNATQTAAPVPPKKMDLGALAVELMQTAGLSAWNLFVLNPELVFVYQNEGAQIGATGCDEELKRAFGRGAGDMMGQSILRFHPAPTRLQGMLGDGSRLPQETTWGFGRVVWKTHFYALRSPSDELVGFAVAWRDESDYYQARAALERLRAQAEDLPVSVMLPDPSFERWFGNPACDHAMERLAPFLMRSYNPVEGVPIQLFLPDERERLALFGSPSSMPLKRRIQIGPETVSFLVAAVLDENQRYLCPQITWEIVHFTPQETAPAAAPPAVPPRAAQTAALAPVSNSGGGHPVSADLRREAQALEAAGQELLMLTRLILSVADDADGQVHVESVDPSQLAEDAARNGQETAQVAEAALAVLAATREVPAGQPRRQETERALATLNGIARRANRLALDGALLAVQDEASTQAAELVAETRSFGRGLTERLRSLAGRAQASSDVLRQSSATTSRLAGLRAQLGDGSSQG